MNTKAVALFRAASQFFSDAVASVPVERYEERWSDEWRIFDLIGHGNRANTLPVEYYERPVPAAGPEYLLPENIAERARRAVAEMGPRPVAAVRAASARAFAMIDAAPDNAMLGTPFGEVPLDAYLRSRVAELVLHGLDLGTGLEPPPEALLECGTFVMERAVLKGHGVEVVQALTGRGTLSPNLNVL